MRLNWPLTGRSVQMDVVEAALNDIDHCGVLIRGPAGIGKSRVAREALEIARSNGFVTHWAVGTQASRAVPGGAFAAWISTPESDSLHMARDVIHVLTANAPGGRVVVGIDDAHLLDDLSTFVVQQIILRGAAKVVLTMRDDTPTAVARAFSATENLLQIELPPLSVTETTSLLSRTLASVDQAVINDLWRLTRGNVLYLRSIVEHEVAHHRLTSDHGRWRWAGNPVIPVNLVDMIESRMGNLPPVVSDVIDALSVGEPIDLAALARITDPAAVEDADRRGLVALAAVKNSVEVRLAHPLFGEVRRHRAPSTTLRRLRGLVAAELAKLDDGNDPHMLIRRASLLLESDHQPDADLLLSAAQHAVQCADLALAEQLAQAAIVAGAGVEATFLRVHALSFMSRGDEAIDELEKLSPDMLDDEERARWTFLRSHTTMFSCRDPERAKSLIDAAAAISPSGHRPYLNAFMATYWSVTGQPERAVALADLFELDELPAVIGAGTAMAISVAYGAAGRIDKAIAAADTGYAITRRSLDAAQMRFIVADGHIGSLIQAGRLREARDVAELIHREATDLPGAAQLFGRGTLGVAHLNCGSLRKACDLLSVVVEVFAVNGDATGWGYRYCLALGLGLAMRGEVEQARRAADAMTRLRHPTWGYLDYELALTQAWLTAASGASSVAAHTLLSAADDARANRQAAAEVICLQHATQLGERSCAARLSQLADVVEGPRVVVAARYATALKDRDGDELASSSKDFETMGDLVAAADAAAHASLTYRQRGLRGSAFTCSSRASWLADGCAANTPAVRAISDRLPISEREREIIMLIADGLSTRAVADRLTLSLRTIENHLYRAMQKTGATSRAELVAMLVPMLR